MRQWSAHRKALAYELFMYFGRSAAPASMPARLPRTVTATAHFRGEEAPGPIGACERAPPDDVT